MTKEVKRYGISGFGGGMIEMDDGAFYHEDDYAAMEQECERIKADRSACWAEFKVMTQSCLAAEKERDAALLQVEALREALAAARQDLVHVYQTGHERIVALGGHCDPVGLMVSQSPGIRSIDAALQAKP